MDRTKAWDRYWSFRLVKEEHGLYERYPFIPPDALVVCYEPEAGRRLYDVFPTIHSFIAFITPIEAPFRNFYEIMREGRPQKPHFDIDVDGYDSFEENDALARSAIHQLVAALKTVIPELVVETDVLLFSSRDPAKPKSSYHLVVDHWCCANEREGRALYEACMRQCSVDVQTPVIDHAVYNKNQQFRFYSCSKADRNNVKELEETILGPHQFDVPLPEDEEARRNMILLASCVSQTQGCNLVQGLVPYERKAVVRRIRSAIQSGTGVIVTPDVIERVYDLMDRYFSIVSRSVFDVRETTDGMIAFARLRPSFCALCSEMRKKQVVHQGENPFVVLREDGTAVFFCRRAWSDNQRMTGVSLGSYRDAVFTVPAGPAGRGDALAKSDMVIFELPKRAVVEGRSLRSTVGGKWKSMDPLGRDVRY